MIDEINGIGINEVKRIKKLISTMKIRIHEQGKKIGKLNSENAKLKRKLDKVSAIKTIDYLIVERAKEIMLTTDVSNMIKSKLIFLASIKEIDDLEKLAHSLTSMFVLIEDINEQLKEMRHEKST